MVASLIMALLLVASVRAAPILLDPANNALEPRLLNSTDAAADSLVAAHGASYPTTSENDPHAHPNPTVLSWSGKPMPWYPTVEEYASIGHANSRMYVTPAWHTEVLLSPDSTSAAALSGPPTLDEAMKTLALHSVRGISEDERHLAHSLAHNLFHGGSEHMRQRQIYAHGIASLLVNRSGAHQQWAAHMEREAVAHRLATAAATLASAGAPKNGSVAGAPKNGSVPADIASAPTDHVFAHSSDRELLRDTHVKALNNRIVHFVYICAMDELGFNVTDDRRSMATFLFGIGGGIGGGFEQIDGQPRVHSHVVDRHGRVTPVGSTALWGIVGKLFNAACGWVKQQADRAARIAANTGFLDAAGKLISSVVDAAGDLVDFAASAVVSVVNHAKRLVEAITSEMAKAANFFIDAFFDMFGCVDAIQPTLPACGHATIARLQLTARP